MHFLIFFFIKKHLTSNPKPRVLSSNWTLQEGSQACSLTCSGLWGIFLKKATLKTEKLSFKTRYPRKASQQFSSTKQPCPHPITTDTDIQTNQSIPKKMQGAGVKRGKTIVSVTFFFRLWLAEKVARVFSANHRTWSPETHDFVLSLFKIETTHRECVAFCALQLCV